MCFYNYNDLDIIIMFCGFYYNNSGLHSTFSGLGAPYMNHAPAPATYPPQIAMDVSAYQNANPSMPPPTYPVAPPAHPSSQQQQTAYYQQPLL